MGKSEHSTSNDNEFEPPCPDINKIRKLARKKGYAIGEHGSKKRDYDLIAVPWTEKAVNSTELVDYLCQELNAIIIGPVEAKPFFRRAVILQIDGWFKHIDLSITPKPIATANGLTSNT
jgi:hypothetical protein